MAFPRLDGGFLRQVAPGFTGAKARAQARIIEALDPVLGETLAAHAIDTRLRIAHFVAQVLHECAGLRTTEEFASGAAYEGRIDLGNRQAGDGRRFKGRGLLQLTGRANYRRMGDRLGLTLEEHPELAADPVISLRIACAYWTERRINAAADADDLAAVTRKINGGLNGLDERRSYLARCKTVLAQREAEQLEGQGADNPVLRRGSRGETVGRLQARLRNRGFALAVDHEFGPATELALRSFQAGSGLEADGIAGPRTWTVLDGEGGAEGFERGLRFA